MVFLSAYEDFVHRTLNVLPNPLAKLDYVGSLRSDQGGYQHWGLERCHGDPGAQAALAQAHTDLWLQVLRAPLCSLLGDLLDWCSQEGVAPEAGAQSLLEQRDRLVPANRGGGSLQHFYSVLSALSALSRRAQSPSQKAA